MDTRIQKIADHYGKNHQTLKAIEEMAELTQALLKGDSVHIAEEMADVDITMEQLRYFHSNEAEIKVIREQKIARQLARMEVEK